MVANSSKEIEDYRERQNQSQGSEDGEIDEGIQTYVNNMGTKNENIGTIKRNVKVQEAEDVDLGSCRTIVLVEKDNP